MKRVCEMNQSELNEFYAAAKKEYEVCKAKGLSLNMARGKPSAAQLELSNELLTILKGDNCIVDGIAARNYGTLEGLPSCRRMFADILGVDVEEVFAAGNASLTLMYDTIAKAVTHGLLHSEKPWAKLDKVKFLCPVPGYDRHFTICESFGIEMINVPMTAEGPDMDMVEELIKDKDVKGMWCVPKYSNPEGIIYSEATIRRIATMKPAASDFVLMWDNAYCVHHLTDTHDVILNMLEECRKVGHEDRALMFCSLSKVTFPGAGVAAMAASRRNIDYILKNMFPMIISFDKLNQVRHIRFLKDMDGLAAHMEKHRALLEPKFRAVLAILDEGLSGCGSIARWTKPNGGYFLSLYTLGGCAKRTVQLCREAGVVLTDAGAAYPYGVDPQDCNIRIAPTLPPLDELETASRLLCVCVRIATLEKLLQRQ